MKSHFFRFNRSAVCIGFVLATLAAPATAQVRVTDNGVIGLQQGQGVLKMQDLMQAIQSGKVDHLDAKTQKAIEGAKATANHTAKIENMDTATIIHAAESAGQWETLSRQAFVDALPPRDRPLGQSLLLGDGLVAGSGSLYIFVSRSMPASLLRAYAIEAMHTGATLVTKGLRKGDTVKEYVLETLEDYNSTDGQVMASMEINPNLFDMFAINVVPTVVWTNKAGLEDIGSGCADTQTVSTLDVPGPQGEQITVEKPECAPLAQSAYYKLAGALKLDYALERFQKAGAPKEAIQTFRERIAQRHANVFEQISQAPGNAMPRVIDNTLDRIPSHILRSWQEDLAQFNVQRSPYGPAFGSDVEDDKDYRRELMQKIEHGLGLEP